MMSARVSAGSYLEGTAPIAINIRPQTGLLDRFRQKVHAPAKDFRDSPFERRQPKQVHSRGRIKFRGKIDVAGRHGVSSGKRAEQGQMADAAATQLRLVRAQGADDAVGLVGRGCHAHRDAGLRSKISTKRAFRLQWDFWRHQAAVLAERNAFLFSEASPFL
jgi:hypothetical protein